MRLNGTSFEIKDSSIFGIILADFWFIVRGLYTKCDTTPAQWIENSAQKNPKIDKTLNSKEVY